MRIQLINAWQVICLGLLLAGAACAEPPVAGLQPNDRIVFVGDSITGQGGRGGYVTIIGAAIKEAHPEWHITLIPLGGSGQGVASWANVEKTSREKAVKLDIPEFDVKEHLDKPADVLVIMLGMNDILSPYVADQPAAIDQWAANYTALVETLRQRVKPRLIGLATITMNTDDLQSPKNLMRAELNKRLVEIARANNCVALQTGQEFEALLQQGRTVKPDFHLTGDMVHPNALGHAAIAQAMLKGLGDAASAQKVADKYDTPFFTAPQLYPALSYTLEPVATPLADGKVSVIVHYWWTPDQQQQTPINEVTIPAPEGWTVTPATQQAAVGTFTLTGTPDRLVNTFTLRAKAGAISKDVTINLPAPWLVGTGLVSYEAWPSHQFDAEKAKLPFESALATGEGLGNPQTLANGQSIAWKRYFPSVNYVGGNDPGSVDLTQVSYARTFEVAYCARWMYSPTERQVQLELGVNTFAGTPALTIYLNGTQLYANVITKEPKARATIPATLTKGWNLLLVKSNHFQWQWQFFCKLAGVEADDLRDLRIAATAKMPETK